MSATEKDFSTDQRLILLKNLKISWSVIPFIVWQFSFVFQPDHCGNEGRVMFDFALEHSAHSSLHHLVLRLLKDAGGLWKTEEYELIFDE